MRFAIAIYPQPIQITSKREPSRVQEIFGEFARNNGITLYDLFPAFRTAADWRKYFIFGDVHWNNEGQAFVADLLSGHIRGKREAAEPLLKKGSDD